ncbi:hypothetical protein [Ruegeria sp.]|uniref:hypothetical protein n=1 Tax=Ruegeria sp. TaxID=1879320 RepID=UPI003AFF95CF
MRGLGLLDIMMAVALLVVLGTSAGTLATALIDRQVSQAEARALSAWADAGAAKLLEEPGRIERARASLQGLSGVQPPVIGAKLQTPYRGRTITMGYYRPPGSPDKTVVLIARAAGPVGPVPAPGAGDAIAGVGIVRATGTGRKVTGPGLDYTLPPGLSARPGDFVALRQVSLATGRDLYLHRRPAGELNRMETDLHMGGHDITGVARLRAPDTTGAGARAVLNVEGPFVVEGNLKVDGALRAGSAKIGGDLVSKRATVQTLIVTKGCSGC